MKGNMMEWGLTIPKLINFAEENFSDNTFVSRSADGSLKSYKYGHSLQNSRKIAGFLKNKIGINLTDRVATIAWNDSYHLETYFAAIGMDFKRVNCSIILTLNTSTSLPSLVGEAG